VKVTIFGGTGFVGSYLIDALLEQGHQAVIQVRASTRHKVQQPGQCILVDTATSPILSRYEQPSTPHNTPAYSASS